MQVMSLSAIDAVAPLTSNEPVNRVKALPPQSTRSPAMNWTGRPSWFMKTSIVVLSRDELSYPPMFNATKRAAGLPTCPSGR
jgi:hypothetical protein